MITTRPARPDDIPHLLDGIARLAAHHDDSSTVTAADLTRDLFDPVPWMLALIAETANGIAGYALLLRLAQVQFGTRGMDLHHLFTWPAHRGTGTGQALVKAAQCLAREHGCTYLTVGTTPDNTSAQAFYLAQGFSPRASYPRFAVKL